MADLVWWLSNFQRSAFRLETLPAYSVPQEVEMLAAFKRGEDVRLPKDHPWLKKVRQHTRDGKRMERVRLVSYPLSDYLRFELSMYPQCVEAGEQIRIASLNEHPELGACNQDCWLFDDSVVLTLVYDSAGRFLEVREATNIHDYLRQRDLALSRSTPLLDYLTRTTRR